VRYRKWLEKPKLLKAFEGGKVLRDIREKKLPPARGEEGLRIEEWILRLQ